MMKMDIAFTWSLLLWLLLSKTWPVVLLLSLGLGWLGIVGRSWWRWVCLVLAGLLGAALLVFGAGLLRDRRKDGQSEAHMQREAAVMDEALTKL